jgi:hypothetical protein
MIVIAANKYIFDIRLIGILKNYSIYYIMSGIFVLYILFYQKERAFFLIFRISMGAIILIGLVMYVYELYNLNFTFTFSDRMISVLGNPNYLAYFSLIYIFVLMGEIYYSGKVPMSRISELILAHLGLLLSFSYSAFLTYFLTTFLILFSIKTRWIYKSLVLRKVLINCIIVLCLVSIVIYKTKFFGLEIFSRLLEEKISTLTNVGFVNLSFVKFRISSFSSCFRIVFNSLQGLLFGSAEYGRYIEKDSGFINLIYNFGLPIFFGWTVYFLSPVLVSFASRHQFKMKKDFNSCMSLILGIFLFSSYFSFFMLQYVIEKFPTSFFIGIICSYVFINSLRYRKFLTSKPNSCYD